jgi:chemotaxis signal transduction protein
VAHRYVVFSLSGADYAIEARYVRHSLAAPVGLDEEVVFLGRSYPILDLCALFRLSPLMGRGRLILVVEAQKCSAGLLIDGIVGLVRLDEAAIGSLPKVFAGVERRWFRRLARIGSRVVAVINVDGILGVQDSSALLPALSGAPGTA